MRSLIDPDPALLDELKRLAVRAAVAAGAELRRRQGHVTGLATKTTATDPVSDADRASEALLTTRILSARPDDGLLGEEGADRPSGTGLRWVLDPLDGTVNYLYGLPTWSVSVCCERADGVAGDGDGGLAGDGWRGLVGVVHDAVHGETYTAIRGQGAWLGRQRLRVNDPVPLDKALLETGFAYEPGRRARQAAMIARLLPRIADIRRAGSAALDLCGVAAGRADAFFEEELSRWDWAAGVLIAREAGAVVTPYGNGLVAAGAALHPALVAAIESVR
jgi:myo-inositol-1(or 4)-monophosphatase